MNIKFKDLSEADLIQGYIYEGGRKEEGVRGKGRDVLKELLGVYNAGGFRNKRPENEEGKRRTDKYAFVALSMEENHPLWQNEFNESSGLLKYFGDNEVGPNFLDTNKRGNAILKETFDKLNFFNITEGIPPFFVFQRIDEREFDLKFLGLAVPGHPDIPPFEDLILYKGKRENDEEFLNYESYFTILDTGEEPISREWIKKLVDDNENSLQYAPTAWKDFIEKGREGIKPLEVTHDYTNRDVKNGCNKLYYGVPGSGKSHKINEDLEKIPESQKERVLFHPDYTYSDFVGQILPKVENKEITYPFTPGPFTRILEKAFHNPDKPYYLIIEEINRGNAPAIFGDVFQLLDRVKEKSKDDLGTSEYSITNSDIASYIYNNSELGEYGYKVKIPSNLSIFATMNTSDQNVFTLDTAFQRRWNMEMVTNDLNKEGLQFDIIGTGVKWNEFCKGMNELIIEINKHGLSSEDKRLGAYFIKEEDFNLKEFNINDVKAEELTVYEQIYKHYIDQKLGQEDKEEFIKEKVKETKIRKMFAEKVLKYLWDDAFKFDRNKIFEKDKDTLFTLEYYIEEFSNPKNDDCFSIFTDKAREYIGLEKKSN